MFKTPVFRFRYYDRKHSEPRISRDFATRQAITAMGVDAVEDTEVMVDTRIVGSAGLILEERMPAGAGE